MSYLIIGRSNYSHKGGLLCLPLARAKLGIAGCPGLVPSWLVAIATTASLSMIITGAVDRVYSTWRRGVCGTTSIDAGCDERM